MEADPMKILESIRLFHFVEPAMLEEIARHVEIVECKKGEILFGRVPHTDLYKDDSNILVVVKGEVSVSVETSRNDHRELLSTMKRGQTVTSIFSILEALITDYDAFDAQSNETQKKTSSRKNLETSSDTPLTRRKRHMKNWNDDLRNQQDDVLVYADEYAEDLFRSGIHDSAADIAAFCQLQHQQQAFEREHHHITEEIKQEVREAQVVNDEEELITAIAVQDSVLGKIPLRIFDMLKEKYPRSVIRLTRAIVTRLQRITLLTVNKYFGITRQLINISDAGQTITSESGLNSSQMFRAREHSFKSEEAQLRYDFEVAYKAMSKLLHLDEYGKELLRQNLNIEHHSAGSIVMAPRDPLTQMRSAVNPSAAANNSDMEAFEPCLYYVIRGAGLSVYLHDDMDLSPNSHDSQESNNMPMGEEQLLFHASSGELVGQLAVITGDFYYRVIASSNTSLSSTTVPNLSIPSASSGISNAESMTVLGKIHKSVFDQMVAHSSAVMYRTVYMIFLQMSPVVKWVDYALDWEQVQAGQTVCHQGSTMGGMYVVLSGRLRAVSSPGSTEHRGAMHTWKEESKEAIPAPNPLSNLVAEYGRGDSFGALEVLTEAPVNYSVIAVRDTELAKISENLFKLFFRKYPQVVVRFSKIIGKSLQKQYQTYSRAHTEERANISTIAVFGVDDSAPIRSFCNRLAGELKQITPTLHLDKAYTLQTVGFTHTSFSPAQESHLVRWLGEMEDIYRVVLYECDGHLSPWTQRCLRQADCILIVGWSDGCYEISELEKYLLKNSKQIAARKELVLLHKQADYPSNSKNWLDLRRGWVSAYHHVMQFKASTEVHEAAAQSFSMNQSFSGALPSSPLSESTPLFDTSDSNPDPDSPAVRIRPVRNRANELTSIIRRKRSANAPLRTSSGRSLRYIPGIIKRGAGNIWKRISHAGNITTSTKMPVFGHSNPKDDVARMARFFTGTAIGLVLGGGGARGCAHVGVIQALEENGIPIDMVGGTSIGGLIGGLYAREPDYINCISQSKRAAKLLSDRWSYLMDITYPRVSFFTGNGLNSVLRASLRDTQIEDLRIQYFVITTNITQSKMMVHREGSLWRYVRASMSLVGFVPPLCDNNSLLVDGGYVNNLPADVMHSFGVNNIIAVDVGSETDTNFFNYGETLSGWWLLWNKWNPFVKREKIPNMSDIQVQLAYVSSEKVLEEVKRQKRCLYLRPPIHSYGTLDFAKYDEIKQVGYTYAIEEIKKWKKERASYSLTDEVVVENRKHRRTNSADHTLVRTLSL